MPYRATHHWGTPLWTFIHTLTAIDSDEPAIQIRDSIKAIDILKSLSEIIPCHRCAQHYREFFQTEIEGRDRYGRMELFNLLVEYHNRINDKLGKQIMALEEARLLWTKTV